MSELDGMQLRYLVDISSADGNVFPDNEITVLGKGWDRGIGKGIPAKLIDLLDSEKDGTFGPYHDDGVPDAAGTGYWKNIHWQLEKAQRQRFNLAVLDNMENEHFKLFELKRAIDVVLTYKMGVLLKNPEKINENPISLVEHINTFGIIVEENCGTPVSMDKLRRDAHKPDLPVWFVGRSFADEWVRHTAIDAVHYHHMGVSISNEMTWLSSRDILLPKQRVQA